MAKYIVPPRGGYCIIVKCGKCRTLYVPNPNAHPFGRLRNFEFCPVCGYDGNDYDDRIPLWKYNLIKWFRGGVVIEQPDDSDPDD